MLDKIVVLDGFTLNPRDLDWNIDIEVYERTQCILFKSNTYYR